MSKRAFLVLGPVSSGTRLMTRILMSVGCEGDYGHRQRWDNGLPKDESCIVWRRSVPHKDWKYPPISKMINALKDCGYRVQAVITSRDWHATASSIVKNHVPETMSEALESIRKAYRHIFKEIGGVRYELVNYEALSDPNMRKQLLKRLGLPTTDKVRVYNRNAKHYRGLE